ncbi:alanine racemase [Biformimicrobium ophioploci]|uniref:Alanine racemase n=1 Tax=Biformimicrobium ophioploci TaxID=3036711 RepID=A0ABQ6LZG4_9GAMM|nr:alanine racemase [Microbulbifer sp. NKW57]GMG87425.1 alanine racemase [Microbulbifer sp. NKW57]
MRPTRVEIDLSAIQSNYRTACLLAPRSRNLAVIKANAYGHGGVMTARALESQVPAFAVAFLEEALELRAAGITKPILLLEGVFNAGDLREAITRDCWVMLHGTHQLDWLDLLPAKTKLPGLWLKVDSGMHRLGFTLAEIPAACAKAAPYTDRLVIATHFASADEPDKPQTRQQESQFLSHLPDGPFEISLNNSAGLQLRQSRGDEWGRAGFMLYGYSPLPAPPALPLEPAMTFKSAVMAIRRVAAGETVGYGGVWQAQRDSLIATIPCGYADGYPQTARAGTPILINGHRAPLAGRVSMDMITVDVTDAGTVKIGDPVQLWGPDLPATEVAAHNNYNPYELLTRVSARPQRVYRQPPDAQSYKSDTVRGEEDAVIS